MIFFSQLRLAKNRLLKWWYTRRAKRMLGGYGEGLKRNAFSLSNTAKDLGMSRTTLWRKLKKFNIIIE